MLCLEANAKINWTLDILGVRPDRYHEMDMLMQAVSLSDRLWLEKADVLSLESLESGAACDALTADALASSPVTYDESNLVFRAARLLQSHCGYSGGARMLLQKNIPSGAGMGGGSADAAAALKGLNELWNLGLSHQQLLALGLKLGADVPFMLTGGLARVSGIGEIISPLAPAPQIHLLFLQPCGGLSTPEVFKAYDSLDPACICRPETDAAQRALLAGDLPALGRAMNNALEGVSMQARPVMKDVCAALEKHGAIRAMMTGSGSVIYGVFTCREAAESALVKMQVQAAQNGWGRVQHMHTLA